MEYKCFICDKGFEENESIYRVYIGKRIKHSHRDCMTMCIVLFTPRERMKTEENRRFFP